VAAAVRYRSPCDFSPAQGVVRAVVKARVDFLCHCSAHGGLGVFFGLAFEENKLINKNLSKKQQAYWGRLTWRCGGVGHDEVARRVDVKLASVGEVDIDVIDSNGDMRKACSDTKVVKIIGSLESWASVVGTEERRKAWCTDL
jgi:hypothetical protein